MQLTETTDDKLLGDGDSFHFWVPAEMVVKSEGGESGKRMIQGIASTADRDLQGEIVLQRGIDFDYFLRFGYINDDHKEGPEHKVGEPVEARFTKDGFWIKGFLYKGKDRSDHWWEHINVLAQSGSTRKVGFSIQGKILRREGKTIAKCWLQDVAITASPVNTNTWAEIVKSLSGQPWCKNPTIKTCKGTCCPQGQAIRKQLEEQEKALSAGGLGRMLVPQSLEGRNKVQTFKSNRISYQEAVQEIVKSWNVSIHSASAIADAIFSVHGTH